MVWKKLGFGIFLFFCTTIAIGQQILVQNFSPDTYGRGASITVPVRVTGCFALNNRFDMYLSDDAGDFTNAVLIGSYNGFFTPFVNGIIPAGTAPSSKYKIQIRSTAPVVSVETPEFSVSATSVNPVLNPIASASNTINDSTFGRCLIFGNQVITLLQNVPAGFTLSARVTDSLNNVITSTVSGAQVQFTMVPGNYYTLKIQLENNSDNSLSTKSFLIYVSNNNLSLQTSGASDACLPDTKTYTVNVVGNGGIRTNYPGTRYSIEWGDGSVDTYTHCEMVARNGEMSHDYINTSCGRPPITDLNPAQNNAFRVNVMAQNEFCPNSFTSITTYAKVWQKPIAEFINPLFWCINVPVTFLNTSEAGLSGYNNVVNCIDIAVYEWYVDGVLQFNAPRDLTYTFTTPGYHTVMLVAVNDPCSDVIEKEICIEEPLNPDFKINGLDSISGCAPLPLNILNTTVIGPNPCRPLPWRWSVLLRPGMTPAQRGVHYTISPHDSATSPNFVFLLPGEYYVRLTIPNSCGDYFKDVPVTITDIANVTFQNNNTRYCGLQTIDFALPPHRPTYNSSSGNENYNWTITGGSFTYVGGTSATSAFPQVQFNSIGSYTIQLQFNNDCGTQNATKVIAFDAQVVATAGNDTTICYSVNSVQLTSSASGPFAGRQWRTNGTGSFSDASLANPVYTLSTADKNAGTVTLHHIVSGPSGSACGYDTATVIISILPDNIITSAPDTTICSGGTVNYIPVSNTTGTVFNWTSSVVSGTVSGNTASGSGTINDVLVNSSSSLVGEVRYTITPVGPGCTGNAFAFTVTVQPIPTLTVSPATDTLCTSGTTAISFSSSYANPLYTYTSTVISGAATGLSTQASPVSSNTINDVLVNNGTVPAVIEYTVQVYTSGVQCSGETKTVTIVVHPVATIANAGSDQLLCNVTTATLAGNQPIIGTGTWTQTGGPATVIVSANANSTVVNGLTGNSTYTFVWTIAGSSPCTATSDTVVIVNRPAITAANAGVDIVYCDFSGTTSSIVLSANIPTHNFENGSWSIIAPVPTGGNPIVSDINNPASGFSFDAPGTYTLVWTITNDAACTPTNDKVVVRVFEAPYAGAITPALSTICRGENVSLAVAPVTGTILKWQYNTAPFNDDIWIDTLVSTSSITFNSIQDTMLVRAIVQSPGFSFGCLSTDTSELALINVSPPSVGGNSNTDTTVCTGANGGLITLSNYVGAVVKWESSVNNGASWVTINNTTDTNDYVNLTATTWYRAIVQSGMCAPAVSDTTIITVMPEVLPASAGNDQLICGNSTTLTNNAPATGETGTWSQISGPNTAVLTTTSSTSNIASGLIAGTYQFVWTLANNVCPSTTDTVEVVVRPAVTTANAGGDIVVCDFENTAVVSLAGNADASRNFETGAWSMISQPTNGNGLFGNVSDPASSFTFSAAGTYALVWTITNDAGCTPTADTVVIRAFQKAVAGPITGDTALCAGSGVSINMSSWTGLIKKWQYNKAPLNDNVWIDTLVTTNSISFVNVADTFAVRVIVQSAGFTYGCAIEDTSNVLIINVDPATVPGTTDADATVCSGNNGATIALSNYVGAVVRWESSVNNGASWVAINNTTNTNDYVNLTATTWYRAIVQSGLCAQAVSDTTIITVMPEVMPASAGNDQLICGNSTTLTNNAPATGETGTWSQISGPNTAVLTTTSSTSNIASGLIAGTYQFVWTLANNVCPSTTDTVEVVVRPAVTTANAGGDLVVCDFENTDVASLSANVDASRNFETGEWSMISQPANGNGLFGNVSDPASSFTFSAAGTYALVWTITNDAGCTPTSDTVVIRAFQKAVAGPITGDTALCAGSDVSINMSSWTGLIKKWQYNKAPLSDNIWIDTLVTNSSISFLNVADTFAVRVIVQSAGFTYGCAIEDTSNVLIINVDPATVPGTTDADATVCSGNNGATIALTNYVGAVVRWESSVNNGASWVAINNTTNTNDYVNLTATTWYRAIVQSGLCAQAVSDTTVITVMPEVMPASAGNDQLICTTSTTLTNNAPATGETGTWSQIAGPNTAILTTISSTSNTASGLIAGTYQFVWTLANNVCPSTTDTVEVVVRPAVTTANAGGDIVVCDFENTAVVSLAGNADASRNFETGAWSMISQPTNGNGLFGNVSDPASSFTFSAAGTYSLVWIITNDAGCTPTTDTVVIRAFQKAVAGPITGDTALCAGSDVSINMSSWTGLIKKWQYNKAPLNDNVWIDTLVTTNNISFVNVSDTFAVRVIVQSAGFTYGCAIEDTSNVLIINVDPATVPGTTDADATVCSGNNGATIALSNYVGAVVRWESSVNNGASWVAINNTTNTNDYVNLTATTWYRAIVQSGLCAQAVSDTTIITVVPAVLQAFAGNDQLICGNSASLNSNAPATGETGTWTQISGPGTAVLSSFSGTNITTSGLLAGTYQFTWTLSNTTCPSTTDTVAIVVRPSVTIANAGNDVVVCDFLNSSTLTLGGNANASRSFETGTWTIIGQPTSGNASFSNNNDPLSTLTFNATGTYQLLWTITNDAGCTPTNDTVIIYAFDRPVAGPINGPTELCAGLDVSIAMASWTGNIRKWQYNPAPLNDNIWIDTLVTTGNINFQGVTDSFAVRVIVQSSGLAYGCVITDTSNTLIVNVAPGSVPGTTGTNATVCSGANGGVVTLTGNVGNIVRWESSTNNGVNWTAISNSSNTLSYLNLTATTWYRVVVESATCGQVRSSTTVITVVPQVTIANAGNNQTTCANSVALLANTPGNLEGGLWSQVNGPNTAALSSVTSPSVNASNLVAGSYHFVWTISNGGCPPSSDTVIVNVRPSITAANAGNDTVICDFVGNTYITLQGNNNPSRIFEVSTWTILSQPANGNATLSDVNDPRPIFNYSAAGTYVLSYGINNDAGCNPSADTIIINVFEKPVAGPITANTQICAGSDVVANLTSHTGIIQKWQYNPAPVNDNIWRDTLVTNPAITFLNVQDTMAIRVIVQSAGSAMGCTSADTSNVVIINVAPATIAGTTAANDTVCNGMNGGAITLTGNVGAVSRWEFSTTSGNSWTPVSNTANVIQYANLTTTTWYRAIIESGNCGPVPSSITIITVIDSISAPDAGADQVHCNVNQAVLSANSVALGETGSWSQLSGTTVDFSATGIPTVTISNLSPGTYSFIWTISNGICPERRDTVIVTNYPAIVNVTDTITRTICFGQAITVSGQQPAGGNGSYTFQWQQSTNASSWVNIAGQTNQSLSFVPTGSVYVRRIIASLPCESISDVTRINVQPPVDNNTIASNQNICNNTIAALITGSLPTGGTGSYNYQWQESTDGGQSWLNIPGANTQNYQPGVLNISTLYRRSVSSGFCVASQSNFSDSVIVSVNPDAQANFTFIKDTSCPVFVLDSTLISNNHSVANGGYLWYANNTLLGTSQGFPGYTISNSGDSVIIRLIAISSFGCKNDTMQHTFYAKMKPSPSLTVNDSVGCGPFTVAFTNTTPNANFFQFRWNFGNGQVSNAFNPGNVVFMPNPTRADTVYNVSLTVYSECDSLTIWQSIRVKAQPRSLFNPDKTFGCSPLTVDFTNLSKGSNDFTWDFGDGAVFNTPSTNGVQHTFVTTVRDTFNVRLIARNECGADTSVFSIVVSPNAIGLFVTVNGTEASGCSPHAVKFYNNSFGATNYVWNFGDGNTITTSKNIDTILHVFNQPGTYTVSVKASNSCSDTTTTKTIIVHGIPVVDFNATPAEVCVGERVNFMNLSDTITGSSWSFGDGGVSMLTHPTHVYNTAGTYTISLVGSRLYGTGNTCVDSATKTVRVIDTRPGMFSVSDSVSRCVPFTVTFTNMILPSSLTTWNFGDGGRDTGNVVTHTFTSVGTFAVTMNAQSPGGCKYAAGKDITVTGPEGSMNYENGIICGTRPVRFETISSGTDSVRWNFGDGNYLVTSANVIFYTYTKPGNYVPSVELITGNNGSCRKLLPGIDTIKVERIKAGFTSALAKECGQTKVVFTDTTRSFFGVQQWAWNFGDGGTATTKNPEHTYTTANTWQVRLITRSAVGCLDTANIILNVPVNNNPQATIISDSVVCANRGINFQSSVISQDSISMYLWSFTNGISGSGASMSTSFANAGAQVATLVVSTNNGCRDTTTRNLFVNPSPVVSISGGRTICLGQPVQLTASGALNYSWTNAATLSCSTCPNPISLTQVTTNYEVTGTNSFGCIARDTVQVVIAQPFQVTATPNDTICLGESISLLASGADYYRWSPAATLNNTTVADPIATPIVRTTYRVVGFDSAACFTDTAFVTISVGKVPTVTLGPDKVVAAGTLYPLVSSVTNGPIVQYAWTSGQNVSCINCPLPIAHIKNDIAYSVKVTNNFGCEASDTIQFKVFCESSQVYIPNLFTPDGDGVNDVLMVRGQGIKTVKNFRIFNRWGEIVFEKANFEPNVKSQGWDGTVRGQKAAPDVYVYTCEVLCENGIPFVYKGNVAIIK